jgi:hypothetical protein
MKATARRDETVCGQASVLSTKLNCGGMDMNRCKDHGTDKNYTEEGASTTKYITHNFVSIQNATRILVE